VSGLVPLQVEIDAWGTFRFLRALPQRDNDWGCLAFFQGTPWERIVTVVPGEALSHALQGHPWPLLRSLGPSPDELCKQLPPETGCAYLLDKSCHTRDAKRCLPGSKLPTCYKSTLEGEQAIVVYEVALALREGRYILVTEGKTFTL